MNGRTKLQKASSLLAILAKIVVVLMVLNAIFMFLLRPLFVKIVHILFDNDFIFKIYTIIKDTFSVLPDKMNNFIFGFIPEPHTNQWGTNLEHSMAGVGTTWMLRLVIILIVIAVLYFITILFRKHYGDIAPFKNDREARRLKKEIIKTTDSRIFDKPKNSGNKEAHTRNVFKWVFNKKVREERRKHKSDRIAKRTISRCLVLIKTTKEQGQPAPVKHYKIIFNNPSHTEASNKVFSKIKDLHNKLIQFTKVTFDQYKQPKDRSIYTFEGSIEVPDIEARSIRKNRNNNGIKSDNQEVSKETQENGNFPLTLLEDKSGDIDKEKNAAKSFAEDKITVIDNYFATADVQADLSYYNVGNSSVEYYYKPRFAKINKGENEIKQNLIKLIGLNGIMVKNDADMIIINVPLTKLVPIDNRKTIATAMKDAKDPTHAIFGIATDNSIIHRDISSAPHMIVGGSTGTGKSVGVNYILTSMSYKATPAEVELALLDPKKVEFTVYENHPCNITKPITSAEESVTFLKYATYIMDDRYTELSKARVRNIDGYNKKARKKNKPIMKKLLIFIDEFADLMMVGGKDVEYQVQRITQMGRAAGIHLVLATQRPSVDVITGIIKNNMDSRLAYKVSSTTDSRVTLDEPGAEELNGMGDSLLKWRGQRPFIRMQGGFLTDEEVDEVVNYLADNFEANPHVDYKARVAREEGEEMDGESAAYQESVSSLNQSRMEFDQENAQNTVDDTKLDTEPSKTQDEVEKNKVKTVTLNPIDYMDKAKKKDQASSDNKAIEENPQEDDKAKQPPKKPSGNRRKTKEEMSEIDNLILNKAFENVEKRRKNRKKKV